MLLNDIGKSPNIAFRKINQHLETNYGFKISKNASDSDLVSIMDKINEEITDLKIKGEDAKTSPEISKRLLILEGIQNLREFAFLQLSAPELKSPDFDYVVSCLGDFVCDDFRISGCSQEDYECSIRDAMKCYRSSKYRFPDDMIEQKVREYSLNKINSGSVQPDNIIQSPVLETNDEDIEEALGDRHGDLEWERQERHVPSSTKNVKPLERGSRGSGADFDYHQQMSQQSSDKSDSPLPMIKDKNGRWVPDPFAAQAAERRKGIVMKENLVKKLRTLLETEVSQAEVMMAAKGFAQELQEMIEKIGRLQNEDLPPVTDQMRETYGTDASSAFQTQIYGALQGVMDSLYTAKGQVDDAVTNMAATGTFSASVDMEKDDLGGLEDPAMSMDAELDNIGDELGANDEFGAADEEEPLGRSMKSESVEALSRKVTEMKKLVEKARRLKEARG